MFNSLNKRDWSILIGNCLDHFDTSLYSFLAPVLAPTFFPSYEPIVQIILTYSIFATSIFTRPIGTLLFGMIARTHGPLSSLSFSLIGVAVTTVAIGCIPSFERIGWVAPFLLTIIRMIRGIFSAGEITIAKLYIMENKASIDAFKASYLYQTSTMLGIIIASASSSLVITSANSELWRLLFWLGGFTGLVGYLLRKYSFVKDEKTNTKELFTSYNLSIFKLLIHNRINILRVAIITSFNYLTYSIPFVVMNNFIPLITDISLETMMVFNTNLLIFDMLFIPLAGNLTKKFKPISTMLTSCGVLLITIVPLWSFIDNSSIWYVTFIRCWIVICGILFMTPVNVWYKNLFNTPDQYLIVGMGNALGTGTIGHMTPAICFSLWYLTNSSLSIAAYITVITLMTLVAIKAARI